MKEVFFSSLVLFQLISAKEDFKLISNPGSDEYVDYINHQNLSWKAKRYFDETWNTRDFGRLFGVLPNHELKSRILRSRSQQSDNTNDLPEFFDAREKWSGCVSIKMIRDQSICGSCWAFAAVEAMSDRICIHSNQQKQVLVSAENLIGCCKKCGDRCEGGFPNAAWVHWYTDGIVTGGDYKRYDQGCQSYSVEPCYSGNRSHPMGGNCKKRVVVPPTCRAVCDNKTELNYETSITFGQKPYALVAIETDIQTEIITNGPVQACFDVYEDFMNYNKGVYQRSKNHGKLLSSHSVKIIGWGVDEPSGVPYWLIANSWGKMWGEDGYFRILRGVNHCGIEDAVVAGLPLEAVSKSNTESLQSYLNKSQWKFLFLFTFIQIII